MIKILSKTDKAFKSRSWKYNNALTTKIDILTLIEETLQLIKDKGYSTKLIVNQFYVVETDSDDVAYVKQIVCAELLEYYEKANHSR